MLQVINRAGRQHRHLHGFAEALASLTSRKLPCTVWAGLHQLKCQTLPVRKWLASYTTTVQIRNCHDQKTQSSTMRARFAAVTQSPFRDESANESKTRMVQTCGCPHGVRAGATPKSLALPLYLADTHLFSNCISFAWLSATILPSINSVQLHMSFPSIHTR